MNEIGALPREWSEDCTTDKQVARAAADHLMRCLGRTRGVHYEFLDCPDQLHRRTRAADFRYESGDTGEIVAVEYTRFVHREQVEAESLRRKGKRFGPRGRMKPVEHEGEQIGSVLIGNLNDEGKELRDFIVQKIQRGQLQAVEANERLLLILDARKVFLEFMHEMNFSFAPSEQDAVDHVFLLRPGIAGEYHTPPKILQVW